MTGPIGEVVETAVAEFTAQACRFNVAPPFGGFVKVALPDWTVYGLVYAIHSGSIDPGGRPVMRGRDGLRDGQIYHENPDLEQVLRTEFGVLVIGFSGGVASNGAAAIGPESLTHHPALIGQPAFRAYLPPQPPPLHWSVQECSAGEALHLTERLDYFRAVLAAGQAPVDALLAANIRLARSARDHEPGFTVRAGRELANLLKHDYPRLSALLRALQ